MSSEWQTFTLAQLGRVVTGKTPKTSDPNNFGGPIPFVTPTDMDGCKTMATTARYLSELGASTVKSSIIPAGSVMVSCIGSDMGKSVIAKHRCVTNQQINSVVVDLMFSSEFVYYNLSMRKAELQHLASGGSTMPILNKGMFSEVKIDLPPLAEQLQIAETLSALDDRITLLRETNATLEAIAQALFKSWFVDFDPVRAKMEGRAPEGMDEATAALFPDALEESELGWVPKGWRVAAMSHLSKISSGDRPNVRSDEITDAASVPLFGGAGVMGFTDQSLYRSRKILTGRVGTLGKVHFGYPPFWASDNVLVLSPEDECNFIFCFHWLKSIDVHALNRGSTQPLLTQKDLGKQQHVIPHETIMRAFSEAAESIYQAIRQNANQAQTLATLRDTLLPRLISGQLRLPEAQALVAAA